MIDPRLFVARDALRLAAKLLDDDHPGGHLGMAANLSRQAAEALSEEVREALADADVPEILQ